MAEEEIKKEQQEEEKPKKKSGFMKLVLFGVIGLLLLGGGAGGAAWVLGLGPFAKPNQLKGKIALAEEKKKPEPVKPSMGPVFPMETFIVNLMSEKGDRYLKVTMNMELSSDKSLEEVTKRSPQLRDAIIILLSSKTFEDIVKIEGKEGLKREILARVNSFLSDGEAKRVYFTEFVVQ